MDLTVLLIAATELGQEKLGWSVVAIRLNQGATNNEFD